MKRIIASFALIAALYATTQVFAERDLETGAFLSRDPAGFVDGPNVYSYVRQNPWTAFDPHGLSTSYADKYTEQVVNTVRAADPRLNQIVQELEDSPHHFEINATWTEKQTKEYGAKGMFTPQTPDRKDALPRETHDRYNGKGMGGRINAPKENVAVKAPEQTMEHELGHAFDANRGITPLDATKPPPSKLFPTRSVDGMKMRTGQCELKISTTRKKRTLFAKITEVG